MKFPNWTSEELLIVLDLYFRIGRKVLSQDEQNVIETSKILRHINKIHFTNKSNHRFRSPDAVVFKLRVFHEFDVKIHETAHSSLDLNIWEKLNNHTDKLYKEVQRIRSKFDIPKSVYGLSHYIFNPYEEYTYPVTNQNYVPEQYLQYSVVEGKSKFKLHCSKERKGEIVTGKKNEFKAKYGRFFCEICNFDFEKAYGDIGKDFIQCHHIRPLSEISGETETCLKDLILVCANCHSIIHRNKGHAVPIKKFKSYVKVDYNKI